MVTPREAEPPSDTVEARLTALFQDVREILDVDLPFAVNLNKPKTASDFLKMDEAVEVAGKLKQANKLLVTRSAGIEATALMAFQTDLEQLTARLTQMSENFGAPESGKKASLERFNILLEAVDIPPLGLNFPDKTAYESERKRLSEQVTKKVHSEILTRLTDTSQQYIPSSLPNIWGGPSIPTNLPGQSKYDLDSWLTSVPSQVEVTIGGKKESVPFLGDTVGYLVSLIKSLEIDFERAVALLEGYESPKDYVAKISAGSYAGADFGRAQLRNYLKKDGLQERNKLTAAGTERDFQQSAFFAFKYLRKRFIDIGKFTTEVDPAKLDRFRDPVTAVASMEEELNQNQAVNMYPVGSKQKGAEEEVKPFVDQKITHDTLVKELLALGFEADAIDIAFRWNVAVNRATGIEEWLDIRPATKEIEVTNAAGAVEKKKIWKGNGTVTAVRTMTRFFHTKEWAIFSVTEKGNLRQPVSQFLAKMRPSIGLPAEMNWLVRVRKPGGKSEIRSMYEVYQDGNWDDVLDEDEGGEFADNPNLVYANSLRFMLPFYDRLFMDSEAATIIPKDKGIAKVAATPKTPRDYRVSKILADAKVGQVVSVENAEYLLGRLETLELDKRLVVVYSEEATDFSAANAIKDAGDYTWDNSVLYPPNFRRLYNTFDGRPHTKVMEAIQTSNKAEYVMYAFFGILLMAELERYKVDDEEIHLAHEEKRRGKFSLDRVLETVSKRHPLNWGDRIGIRRFLVSMQAHFPDAYKDYAFGPEQLDFLFKRLNIEGNEATNLVDAQWLINGEKPLRADMRVFPLPFANDLLGPILQAIGGDEGVR